MCNMENKENVGEINKGKIPYNCIFKIIIVNVSI